VLDRTNRRRPTRAATRYLWSILLVAAAVVVLAACGGSSSSSSAASGGSSSGVTSSSGGSSSSLPGKGKPALTLGTKNFTEELIIGELYKQYLQHEGYTINYKPNIGSTEIVDKALTSGQIDAYPEYLGESFSTVFTNHKVVKSAQDEYNTVKKEYAKRGQSMSDFTPFEDTDTVAVLKSYAQAHDLHSIGDLKKVGTFTYGAQPPTLTRFEGVVGLKKLYGLTKLQFKPLAVGLQYQALDAHNVDTADAFSTDPQLLSGKYVVLSDPKHLFGFQNVALVINTKKLKQLGGATFLKLIDKVNALLTQHSMIALNKAVAIDKQTPSAVASAFLKANGLT
jgi:osmoprotectant transport system substrate-binding protein